MSKFKSAADVLKRGALKYEQMIEAAKVLDEIGSLEQSANEFKNAAEKASKEKEVALKALDDVNNKITNTLALAAAAEVEAREKAATLVAYTDTMCENKVDTANQQASNITADAQKEAKLMMDTAKYNLDAINKKIATTESRLVEAEALAANATSDAAKAEARLSKIKESIAKLAAE